MDGILAYLKGVGRSFFAKPESGNIWSGIAIFIPEIVGLVTLFAGGFIVITSVFGRKALLRPLAFLAAFYILAIIALEVAT